VNQKRRAAAIYTRISKDRNGESLAVDRQESACRQLARLAGFRVVGVYTDNDISAFNGKRRDGFEDLLAEVQAGRIDVVLCQHTDRLYRRLADLVRLCEAGPNLLIKTVQGADLDLSNATGKMVATILGSVQEQESAHHSERRKVAYIQKAELGVYGNQGYRTFGYTRDGEPLEPEATMYRQAAADLLEGKSLMAIAREWNASGVTTTVAGRERELNGRRYVVEGVWSSTRIRRLLLNPRYANIKTHLGKVVGPGTWTRLIDEDTHKRVVAELRDPSRQKVTCFERKYVGSGVYLCGVCGATLQVSFPGKKRGGRRRYVCSAHICVSRLGEPLDDYVENVVLERLSQPDANLLIAKPGQDHVGTLQDERAGWVTKLDNLVDLIEDGTLDGPKARKRAATYKDEIAAIDAKLAAAVRTSPTAALLASGKELRARWTAMTPAIRSQVIDEVAVVKVRRGGQGRRPFDPTLVDIIWRVDTAADTADTADTEDSRPFGH
jgi:DNA invertase Pin-like site-specific DNA recombinase